MKQMAQPKQKNLLKQQLINNHTGVQDGATSAHSNPAKVL